MYKTATGRSIPDDDLMRVSALGTLGTLGTLGIVRVGQCITDGHDALPPRSCGGFSHIPWLSILPYTTTLVLSP